VSFGEGRVVLRSLFSFLPLSLLFFRSFSKRNRLSRTDSDFRSFTQTRKPRSIFVDVQGKTLEYEILNVCEFNSTRKRMSTVVRGPDGKIKLYCKGADTVIFERLAPNNPYVESTMAHLEVRSSASLFLSLSTIPLSLPEGSSPRFDLRRF